MNTTIIEQTFSVKQKSSLVKHNSYHCRIIINVVLVQRSTTASKQIKLALMISSYVPIKHYTLSDNQIIQYLVVAKGNRGKKRNSK